MNLWRCRCGATYADVSDLIAKGYIAEPDVPFVCPYCGCPEKRFVEVM